MSYIKKADYVDTRIRKPFPGKYNLVDLSKMMTYARPAGSKTEKVFISKFIDPIPKMRTDPFGNRLITVGKNPTTLFTSHTDTVHDYAKKRVRNKEPYQYRDARTGIMHSGFIHREHQEKDLHQKQRYPVLIDGKWLKPKGGDILGADDTTGVWMMLNMIHAKKPGKYIFHREEEIGGKGSQYIAEKTPQELKGIKRAISFDRKGYGDVITHQRGGRTASDKFAKSLSKQLGGDYRPSQWGTFTDSASYSRIVPECTNISVGFKGAHTREEKQNLRFAGHLYRTVLGVDFETLPVERDPKVAEYDYDDYSYFYPQYQHWDDTFLSSRKPKYTTNQYKFKTESKTLPAKAKQDEKFGVEHIDKIISHNKEKAFSLFNEIDLLEKEMEKHPFWSLEYYQKRINELDKKLIGVETDLKLLLKRRQELLIEERKELQNKKQKMRNIPFNDSEVYDYIDGYHK